jgi:hypothetical protein
MALTLSAANPVPVPKLADVPAVPWVWLDAENIPKRDLMI